MRYSELVRFERELAREPARGGVEEGDPAAPAVAAALRLAAGRSHGHALRVARVDLLAIEDTVRGSFTGRSAPAGGEELVVGDER